jgi:hypothetical protein
MARMWGFLLTDSSMSASAFRFSPADNALQTPHVPQICPSLS